MTKRATKPVVLKGKFPHFALDANNELIADEFTTPTQEAEQLIVSLDYRVWLLFNRAAETFAWRTRWEKQAEGYEQSELDYIRDLAFKNLGDFLTMDRLLPVLAELNTNLVDIKGQLNKLDNLDQLPTLTTHAQNFQQLQALPEIKQEISEITTGDSGLGALGTLATALFGPEAAIVVTILQALPQINTSLLEITGISSQLTSIKENIIAFFGGGEDGTPITKDLSNATNSLNGVESKLQSLNALATQAIQVFQVALNTDNTPYLASLPFMQTSIEGINQDTDNLSYLSNLTHLTNLEHLYDIALELKEMSIDEGLTVISTEKPTVNQETCKRLRAMFGSTLWLLNWVLDYGVIAKALILGQAAGLSFLSGILSAPIMASLAVVGLEIDDILDIFLTVGATNNVTAVKNWIEADKAGILGSCYFATTSQDAYNSFENYVNNESGLLLQEYKDLALKLFYPDRFHRFYSIAGSIDNSSIASGTIDGKKTYHYEFYPFDCGTLQPPNPCGGLSLGLGTLEPSTQVFITNGIVNNGEFTITFADQSQPPDLYQQVVLFQHSAIKKQFSTYVTFAGSVTNNACEAFGFDCNNPTTQWGGTSYPTQSNPFVWQGTGLSILISNPPSSGIATLTITISDI